MAILNPNTVIGLLRDKLGKLVFSLNLGQPALRPAPSVVYLAQTDVSPGQTVVVQVTVKDCPGNTQPSPFTTSC